MAKTYRAAVVKQAGGPFELVERPIPTQVSDDSVIVRVLANGLCHSDSFVQKGHWPGLDLSHGGRAPGHEIIGLVLKRGVHVPDMFKEGTRVGIGWHGQHCFACESCRRGDFITCANGKVTGIHNDGGYSEVVIVPYHVLAIVPDNMKAEEAAPLMCAGVTVFNSLRNAGVRPPAVVVVQGIGGLGSIALQVARRMGYEVVALSTSDDKRELAMKLGANHYFNVKTADLGKEIRALGGASCILATAPHGKDSASLIPLLAPRGKLIQLGATNEPIPVNALDLIGGGCCVAGWPSGTARDSQDMLKFASVNGLHPIIETFPLERVNEAYDRMMTNKARFRAVIVHREWH